MSKTLSELKPGLTGTAEMIVTEAHTAAAMGSGRMAVLATPALVALMEAAAQNAIAACLPDDHQSVGSAISVRHEVATPVGMRVLATAVLTQVAGRNLHFQLSASDAIEAIARGEHERSLSRVSVFARMLRHKEKEISA